jgi:hypothetical protein
MAARRSSKAKSSLRAQFFKLDDRLAALGVPPLTAWWRAGIGQWLDAYEQGHVLELWGCCGRGSSKSTALYKLALFFTLFGDFRVPPGERHYAVVLSRLVEEAEKAIPIIAAWLTVLGVGHRVVGEVIELAESPRGIRVVAASVSATSGWRAFFVGKDERSKWPSGGVADLDSEEIDTSAAAMTATHPFAAVVSFGSAWGMFGAFYDAITSGSDGTKVSLGPTPTWVAAPHITEADCRRKERNPRRFKREYACEFQAGALGCFEVEDIDRAFEPRDSGVEAGPQVVVIDASSGQKDTWTYGVVGWEHPRGPGATSALEAMASWEKGLSPAAVADLTGSPDPSAPPPVPFLRFSLVAGFDPTEARALGSAGIVSRVATVARLRDIEVVHGDQRESFSLQAEFRREKMRLQIHDWTDTSKVEAVELVRKWFREGVIALPPHETMRRELLSFEEKITAKGAYTFGARGSGHDDFVSLLLTAAMASISGGLRARLPRPEGATPRKPTVGYLPNTFGINTDPTFDFWNGVRSVGAPSFQKVPGWWKRGGGHGGMPPAPAGGGSDF